MSKPTAIYLATCQECKKQTYTFFIPAEGQTEIHPAPCDECGAFVKLEVAHPENTPSDLIQWFHEAKETTKQ